MENFLTIRSREKDWEECAASIPGGFKKNLKKYLLGAESQSWGRRIDEERSLPVL